jgi:serine/threonine protein kinase
VLETIQTEEQFKMPVRPPNLFEYLITRGKALNLGDIQVIARDILLSLHQIHSKGVIHLDLQPLNLLVMDNLECQNGEAANIELSFIMDESNKSQSNQGLDNISGGQNRRLIHLTNFCHSSGFLRKKFSSNFISSLYFMSPERICGEIDCENDYVAAKADVWSVGVILFLLVFGKPPFDGKLNTSLVKSIKNGNVKLKDNKWDDNLQLFV